VGMGREGGKGGEWQRGAYGGEEGRYGESGGQEVMRCWVEGGVEGQRDGGEEGRRGRIGWAGDGRRGERG